MHARTLHAASAWAEFLRAPADEPLPLPLFAYLTRPRAADSWQKSKDSGEGLFVAGEQRALGRDIVWSGPRVSALRNWTRPSTPIALTGCVDTPKPFPPHCSWIRHGQVRSANQM